MKIIDFREPVEVWRAVEGDPDSLVAYLRGDGQISRWMREELADYLEGTLQPMKLPRGRPPKNEAYLHAEILARYADGHDLASRMGVAGWHFTYLRRFMRRKGWHRNNPGWKDRLRKSVARRHGVNDDLLRNYLDRAHPTPTVKPGGREEYVRRRRLSIAMEVRRAKMGDRG